MEMYSYKSFADPINSTREGLTRICGDEPNNQSIR